MTVRSWRHGAERKAHTQVAIAFNGVPPLCVSPGNHTVPLTPRAYREGTRGTGGAGSEATDPSVDNIGPVRIQSAAVIIRCTNIAPCKICTLSGYLMRF